jgi:hypothetical protein
MDTYSPATIQEQDRGGVWRRGFQLRRLDDSNSATVAADAEVNQPAQPRTQLAFACLPDKDGAIDDGGNLTFTIRKAASPTRAAQGARRWTTE